MNYCSLLNEGMSQILFQSTTHKQSSAILITLFTGQIQFEYDLLHFTLYFSVLVFFFFFLNFSTGAWRDGSVIMSVQCSSEGPEFNSQHLHQVALVQGIQLLWLHGHMHISHIRHTYTYLKIIK